MPRISAFYGITIWMYHGEGIHSLAHFHARYGDQAASFTLGGRLLAGNLPARARRLVVQWAALHHDELLSNWERARRGEPLAGVEPLP